jgi:hypothetical protein
MNNIKKEDLIENEIYIMKNNVSVYIFELKKNIESCFNIYQNASFKQLFKDGNFNRPNYVYEKAKNEEKHWLKTCIKLDKFV